MVSRKLYNAIKEDNKMNREEILKKAQSKNMNQPDEMELEILQKGCKWGMIVGMIICIIFMFLKIALKHPWSDIYSIYCYMAGACWGYKWFRLRRKHDFYYTILWSGVATVLFIAYICTMLS